VEGEIILNLALLFGGLFVFVGSLKACRDWRRFPPPEKSEREKDGMRLGMYGAFVGAVLLSFGMLMFAFIGLLN
jgi:hypothetical protein